MRSTVWELLAPLRDAINWSDATPAGRKDFGSMSLADYERARERDAFCWRHGGARVAACETCRRLAVAEGEKIR